MEREQRTAGERIGEACGRVELVHDYLARETPLEAGAWAALRLAEAIRELRAVQLDILSQEAQAPATEAVTEPVHVQGGRVLPPATPTRRPGPFDEA